jgi:hypothetical protein
MTWIAPPPPLTNRSISARAASIRAYSRRIWLSATIFPVWAGADACAFDLAGDACGVLKRTKLARFCRVTPTDMRG